MANISEEKAEEQAAVRTQRLYQALLEHSHDNIALISADGRTVYQSPAVTRQLGYSPAELVGRNNLDLVHPDDVAPARQRLERVIAGVESPQPLRLRCRHRDEGW